LTLSCTKRTPMMQRTDPNPLTKRIVALAQTLGLAVALAAMPTLVPFHPDAGATLAKAGNGGGQGGGNGNRGGNGGNGHSSGKGKAGTKGSAKTHGASAATDVSLTTGTAESLHPRDLGKWNASNASQTALDAHIRNQNFNGPIGGLAQFQLAARAAAGAELTAEEQAALDSFLGDDTAAISDQALADALNAGALPGDPVYAVDGGVVSCTENCGSVDLAAAQAAVDAEAAQLADAAEQAALDDFLRASEARIVDESNKKLSPDLTEDLLNELAERLSVTRAAIIDELTDASGTTGTPVTTVQ
jgi:hypothetical protein